jgi:lipopolysaccharide biosynthesis glycosyltransferase
MTKVLYLDSDLIVRSSLEMIWEINLEGYAVAAIENPPFQRNVELGLPSGARYFNAGVLLMNLAYWREHDVVNRALSFIEENQQRLEYWDQDALNVILCESWLQLPSHWNAQHGEFSDWRYGYELRKEIRDPAIVHFSGDGLKPWQWSLEHPFKSEYHKYRRKTPWRRYRMEGTPRLTRRLRRQLRVIIQGAKRITN